MPKKQANALNSTVNSNMTGTAAGSPNSGLPEMTYG